MRHVKKKNTKIKNTEHTLYFNIVQLLLLFVHFHREFFAFMQPAPDVANKRFFCYPQLKG